MLKIHDTPLVLNLFLNKRAFVFPRQFQLKS
jgi:hypothetical protein